MSKEANEIRYLCEELRVIHRNLVKDNADRRSNFKVLEYKLEKLNKLKLEFTENREKFNSELREPKLVDRIKSFVVDIEKYFDACYGILTERLNTLKLNPVEPEVDFEHDLTDKEVKMSEKFDLRTAAGLIPVMNGSEAVTKQLIDAIGLYDSLLDDNGKTLLTTYVLKTRLSESAKIRLESSYTSNALLIDDLKKYFISKKSSAALSTKLNSERQNSRSIDEFGRSLEELMVDLTLTQAEGNEQNANVLRPVNEKIAINAFANGLSNQNLRTIIKARNYQSLNDAIRGAKDEEISLGVPREMFRLRANNNFAHRGSNRGNFRSHARGSFRNFDRNNSNQFNNSNNNRQFQQQTNSNYWNRNSSNSRFHNNRRGSRGSHNNGHRGYFMQNENNSRNQNINFNTSRNNSNSSPGQLFFRD